MLKFLGSHQKVRLVVTQQSPENYSNFVRYHMSYASGGKMWSKKKKKTDLGFRI